MYLNKELAPYMRKLTVTMLHMMSITMRWADSPLPGAVREGSDSSVESLEAGESPALTDMERDRGPPRLKMGGPCRVYLPYSRENR